jgi:hypothetical protein
MKLTFENPTAKVTNRGKVQAFIAELSKHPNKWAVYTRTAKHISYYHVLSSQMDNLMVSVRQNANKKSYTIYMKWLSDAEAKIRKAERAKKRAALAKKSVAGSKRSSVTNKKK